MTTYREKLETMPSLGLIACGEAMGLPPSLCWRCSKPQAFYASPCEHCDAINPNVDLDGALAQSGMGGAPLKGEKP